MVISVYGRNFRQRIGTKQTRRDIERLRGASWPQLVHCNDGTELVEQLTVEKKSTS